MITKRIVSRLAFRDPEAFKPSVIFTVLHISDAVISSVKCSKLHHRPEIHPSINSIHNIPPQCFIRFLRVIFIFYILWKGERSDQMQSALSGLHFQMFFLKLFNCFSSNFPKRTQNLLLSVHSSVEKIYLKCSSHAM